MGIKCPKCNEGEFVRRAALEKAAGAARAFSTVVRVTPIAISLLRTCPSRNPARSVARHLSWKSSKIGTVRTCLKEGCDFEVLAPEVQVAPSLRKSRPEPAKV